MLLIVGVVVAMDRSMPWLMLASTARWAAGTGGALGLVVGVFEARAIQRALEAERLRLRQRAIERERDRLEEFADVVATTSGTP